METQHTRYQDIALEACLKSLFDKISGKVKLESQRFGLINQPELIGGHMAPLTEGNHLECQQLIDKVGTDLPANAISFQTAEKEKSAEKQVRDLQNKSAEAKGQQAEINTKVKNTPYPINLIHFILALTAVVVICLFDGIQTIPIYQTWGFDLFVAIACGFLFACVLAVLAHSFNRIVALGKTIWQQRIIAIILSVLIIVLFAFMGNVRAEYLTGVVTANGADTMNIHFSAVPFVLTSVLLFMVAVTICHFYLPTYEQREALSAYYRLRRQKKAVDKEVSQLDESIKTIEAELTELKINRDAIKSYGATLEELIINHAKSCYNLWKHENLFHRQDKGKPDCFDEPYPFSFKTNFLNNDNKHE